MKRSDIKADKYLSTNKIFPILKTSGKEIWGVEGDTGVWEVVVDETKDLYSCTCPNVRIDIQCSHKKAVKEYKKRYSNG